MLEIGPGATIDYVLTLKVAWPGKFDVGMTFFEYGAHACAVEVGVDALADQILILVQPAADARAGREVLGHHGQDRRLDHPRLALVEGRVGPGHVDPAEVVEQLVDPRPSGVGRGLAQGRR